jgi:hypothetical protein
MCAGVCHYCMCAGVCHYAGTCLFRLLLLVSSGLPTAYVQRVSSTRIPVPPACWQHGYPSGLWPSSHADSTRLTRCARRLAIGNAPWPIGVTSVGIHERSAREKISHVMNTSGQAHIMNDEATRKYLQGLKRLISFVQRAYPTDPSRWGAGLGVCLCCCLPVLGACLCHCEAALLLSGC